MMNQPLERDALQVYETLVAGGLVLLPTDVSYGLVAMEEDAVRRLYELKGRPASKPCITVANAEIFERVVLPIADDLRTWVADVATRAPIAVIADLNPRSELVASMSPFVLSQATQSGTIATFHSAGPLVERVAEIAFAHGRLVIGSSANLSGTGNNYAFAEVPETVRAAVDLAIDHGRCWYANDEKLATTILDLRTGKFQRKGIEYARIERAWNQFRPLVAVAS